MKRPLSTATCSLGIEHGRYVMDRPSIDLHTSNRFDSLLKNAADFRANPSSLRAMREAWSRPHDETGGLEQKTQRNIDPHRGHALRALAVSEEQVLPTSPRRISRKLNVLRDQLASAPASLHGHLHSACYEALLKSGDLTSHRPRPKLDARALSMRSGSAPNSPRSALLIQHSNTVHHTPVCGRAPPRPRSRASRAAAEAAVAREKLRSAPAALYSHDDLGQFGTSTVPSTSRTRSCLHGKLRNGSPFRQQRPYSALKRPLTLEEEQLRARCPGTRRAKSVTFDCKPTSPYNCKMSNRENKSQSFRGLNYTGVTGRSGTPLDVEFMELKAKNSLKRASDEPEPLVRRSDLHQDALHFASTLDLLCQEVEAQQKRCARLTRSLQQQKDMLRLIKRNKGRRPFTCDNINSRTMRTKKARLINARSVRHPDVERLDVGHTTCIVARSTTCQPSHLLAYAKNCVKNRLLGHAGSPAAS
ncbi:hypothetical protein AXG93_285s1070 [Marchantia polymorpha subsp. ruderalis]|uniref:Uncharacterized protein n=1 Tax=Marchantia polymorpha subsp. ruderalis TaxID=1480154 RepID=A0A176VRH1_MARPO|nr:hypothetical protein AXG93_285s1070 [Marchantia polymorpha subsp. ruderalis]